MARLLLALTAVAFTGVAIAAPMGRCDGEPSEAMKQWFLGLPQADQDTMTELEKRVTPELAELNKGLFEHLEKVRGINADFISKNQEAFNTIFEFMYQELQNCEVPAEAKEHIMDFFIAIPDQQNPIVQHWDEIVAFVQENFPAEEREETPEMPTGEELGAMSGEEGCDMFPPEVKAAWEEIESSEGAEAVGDANCEFFHHLEEVREENGKFFSQNMELVEQMGKIIHRALFGNPAAPEEVQHHFANMMIVMPHECPESQAQEMIEQEEERCHEEEEERCDDDEEERCHEEEEEERCHEEEEEERCHEEEQERCDDDEEERCHEEEEERCEEEEEEEEEERCPFHPTPSA